MANSKTKEALSPTLRAEKKRAEVLRAAAKRFRKSGFHLTSMHEICAETGLGPGAVYRYFPSKDAIIEAMAEDERQSARALIAQVGDTATPADLLASLTQAFAERYASPMEAGMMAEVYAEGLRNKRVGSVVRRLENSWLDALTGRLAQAQAANQMDRDLDPRQLAMFLTAAWDGLAIRQAYHQEGGHDALRSFFAAMLQRIAVPTGKPERKPRGPATPDSSPATPHPAETASEAAETRQLSLI